MPSQVAIIVRSKNEMPHLRTALDMLQKQTFSEFELFAVDSGSTDGSVDLLRHSCDADHLTEIPPETYAPGNVLNEAIAQIPHEIIVLLNADAIPQSEVWLEKLIRPLLDATADATFSRQIARPAARFIVAYDYQRAYDPKTADPSFFSAVACAFKRELWEQQPFRETGYAEDAAWAKACSLQKSKIRLAEHSIVEHSHNYRLKELFQKMARQGRTFSQINAIRPNPGKRTYLCLREIVRDFLYACRRFQPQTIPYNTAYRITIHAGLERGLKEGLK